MSSSVMNTKKKKKKEEESNKMVQTTDLFKNIRDQGNIHPKTGTIKDKNIMDLTEAEYIKETW